MKKKIIDFINSKGGKGVVIGTSCFFVFGLACFVVGYGLVDGWAKVIAWFGGRWAMMVYIFVGLWTLIVLWLVYLAKSSKGE